MNGEQRYDDTKEMLIEKRRYDGVNKEVVKEMRWDKEMIGFSKVKEGDARDFNCFQTPNNE